MLKIFALELSFKFLYAFLMCTITMSLREGLSDEKSNYLETEINYIKLAAI